MSSLRLLYVILITALFCIINLSSVFAAPKLSIGEKDIEHARSAFYFIKKENWAEARNHARAAHDPSIGLLVSWIEFRSANSGANFEDITAFIQKYPEWPDNALLKRRATEAITPFTSPQSIIAWYRYSAPTTGDEYKIFASAQQKLFEPNKNNITQEEITSSLRQAWRQSSFSKQEEKEFLEKNGSILTKKDYTDRINQLLWQRNLTQATRIIPLVEKPYQQLFEARVALIKNKKNAEKLASSVPKTLRMDEGLLYDRIIWHNTNEHTTEAGKLLLLAPVATLYPHKWWDLKNNRIRVLIKERKFQEAYQLAAKHDLEKGEDFAEAEWLSGWIALRFLHKPAQAYKHFYTLYQGVKFPISLSRGAYWAGRAAEQNNNKDIATNWYTIAAQYQDSFYGQLALLKLSTNHVLSLPEPPIITATDIQFYKHNMLVKASYIAEKFEEYDFSKKLLKSAITTAKTTGEIRLITEFGLQLQKRNIAVETAKYAARQGTIITSTSYPIFTSMPDSTLEKALTLAIIRQESSFDTHAKSPVGALGLMQLMPATAQDMAKELQIRYQKQSLLSEKYNIQLGNYYLEKLLRKFSGSYILAIASYNGGQGNVRKWLKDYGDPREIENTEEVIDWIEKIPFSETRNYVQRVLEGTQIYRHLLNHSPSPHALKLEKDLQL